MDTSKLYTKIPGGVVVTQRRPLEQILRRPADRSWIPRVTR